MSLDFTSDAVAGDYLNVNNANAAALLSALGFDWRTFGGECSVPEARRAIIRAKNRRSLSAFTRQEASGPRHFQPGFTEEDLLERIDRFAEFVENNARIGAKVIRWS